jgi:hypothetical protein
MPVDSTPISSAKYYSTRVLVVLYSSTKNQSRWISCTAEVLQYKTNNVQYSVSYVKDDSESNNTTSCEKPILQFTMMTATATCSLQVKLLNSDMVLLEKVPLNETVDQLYARIAQIETATQQWKLLLITSSPRTMRLANDCQKTLRDYGVEVDRQYRLEVILASFNVF